MNPPRLLTRFLLAAAAVLATAVGFLGLRQLGGLDPTAWATLAAVLAVVAATVSAWTGQRLVELQEDALAPNVQVAFDARRRYQFVQLCMTNRGLSPAHHIRIDWQNAPTNDKGDAVELGSGGVVPVLNPGEEASALVNGAHQFFEMGEPLVFYGRLSFNDASGNRYSKQLVVSAEHERRALLHQSEEPKTLYELQKLPGKLDVIATELRGLRDVVARLGPGESE